MVPGTTVLGRFRLEERAGEGGTGTVFRAVDVETNSEVAVKAVRIVDEASAVRFEREAAILSRLQHPGLVRYVAHGVSEAGEHYLVMDWLKGEDLRARLARGGLTSSETLTLSRRIADVLTVVHNAGLLHRDIKPGNIFLCDGDVAQARLIDFGLARMDRAQGSLTMTGAIVGTPAYMAPEQARGARDLDGRADLFSLGCVLYKCLTARPPFEGAHAVEVLTKVLLTEPPRIWELVPGVSRQLAQTVHRLLEKHPEQRPQSAAALSLSLLSIKATTDSEEPPMPTSSLSLRGITSAERRAVSVLLIEGDERTDAESELSDAPILPIVLEHHGRLMQLTGGTRVIVLEGAHSPSDEAANAARCALAIRRALSGARMALATGAAALVGYRPEGGVIERAAKLLATGTSPTVGSPREMRTDSQSIAIDDETAALVGPRFDIRRVGGALSLFGERDSVLGTRTLLGKQTTLVGRDWELSGIAQLWTDVLESSAASAVLVTGAAGMGKSRLAQELLSVFQQDDPSTEIWICRAEAGRAQSALWLVGQLLRDAAGIRSNEPQEAQRRKLADRVSLRAPRAEAALWVEFLCGLIGAPPREASPAMKAARADPQMMSEHLSRAWLGFVRAECEAHPLVLVLEDLHWADGATVRFVGSALGALADLPFFVLSLGRPEVHQVFPSLWRERNVQVFRLSPLSAKASLALVRQVLGNDTDTALAERITAQAAGNAFYLEELIRAVSQSAGEELAALPETVLAMVQSRFSRLETEPRRILRAGSIFGPSFWPGGVQALLGELGSSISTLTPWLDALVTQEILVRRPESRFEGEPELAFRHALLRDGAYAMLTDADRVLGHELAGEWLEQRGEQDPAVLADHFDRGQKSERAAVFYLRAARQMLAASDTDSAMTMARRGLTEGAPDDVRKELLSLLCEAHTWRDEWTIASDYATQVLALGGSGSAAWATALRAKLGHALREDDLGTFLSILQTLGSVDPSPEAAGAVILALATATYILSWSCRFEDASSQNLRMMEIVHDVAQGNPTARGFLHMSLSIRHALVTGEPWIGLLHAESALTAFKEANHSRGVLLARFAIGGNAWGLGAFERAEKELSATLVADQEFGLGSSLRALFLGHALAGQGAFDDAKITARRMIERSSDHGSPRYEGQARVALADILLQAGEIDAAMNEARTALALPQLMPLDRMHATAVCAKLFLELGNAPRALAAAERAMAQYLKHNGLGGRYLFARLVYAETLHKNGLIDRAERILASTREQLVDRASQVADAHLRASYLERVPEHARILALGREWLP